MESKINHESITTYSKSYAEKFLNSFFSDKSVITGPEILELCNVKQVNLFVIRILFKKWKSETENLKSPYFDYSSIEIREALNNLMNLLSKSISISKDDFRPILTEATYKTLLLIFSPYEYYLREISHPDFNTISIQDLRDINKYIKINKLLMEAYIREFENNNIEEVFKEDAIKMFNDACESIKEIPDDFDTYLAAFSEVLPLELSMIYSDVSIEDFEDNQEFSNMESTENESDSNRKTLLDTLAAEKTESLADIHEKQHITGIKKSITINQRFMFINELFSGNQDEFEMVINYLDNCNTKKEALEFININYVEKKNWDLDKEEVQEFFDVLTKRFL